MLLSYLTIGSMILQRLETKQELKEKSQKLTRIENIFDWIAVRTWEAKYEDDMSQDEWKRIVKKALINISQIYEGEQQKQEFLNERNMSTKWTFSTALLYSLTVL